MNKREIGSDGALTITGHKGDVPITNVTYNLDSDISETQFNSGLTQSIVATGVSYGGSFEHDGANDELRQAVRTNAGKPIRVDQITVKESERTLIFRECLVGSYSKDIPSDDRTSASYDFTAEKVTIKE